MASGLADVLTAFGLMLVIEGLTFAAAPGSAKRALATLLVQPAGLLRGIGILAMLAGLILVWAVRG
ncbi:MAG TPA: DUF2065 domain-containing protein [Dongiaceae bacterium]|jgi:uncharacterized protein YjeT (DUF2065 family)|nr:DUF2065 domain-containing protein [Dongiaceae bacterium]